MKKVLLLLSFITIVFGAFAQNTSPLKLVSFHEISNGIVDLVGLKQKAGRDSDFDGNKAALIRIKAQGFQEKILYDFTVVQKYGVEVIYKEHKDGELWVYVSSNCVGAIMIKYLGDFEFSVPKLKVKGDYELTLTIETATLVIRTAPLEADIFIDNEEVGKGEAIKHISIGSEHRYRVSCDDYYTKEGIVKFDKKDEKLLNVELEPNFGYITIKSEPTGADVYVDKIKVGTTPYLAERIAVGQRRLEIKKAGYFTVVEIADVKVGEHYKQLEKVILEKDENYVEQPPEQSVSSSQTITTYSYTCTFSVSSSKKVQFAKGNLQYQSSTKTWRFAEHQWDIIGDANKNISPSYSGWIDLFGWGTGNNPTNISTNNSDYSSFNDWGKDISDERGKNWFTLTRDEWVYVFDKRSTSSGIRYAKATVNGVNGVILLPDNWSSLNYNLSNTNMSDASFDCNNISQNDWVSKFESNNAVFLPAAGSRHGMRVTSVVFCGCYWSATYDVSGRAYGVYFYDSSFYAGYWDYSENGQSVRLVCDVE